MTTSAIASHEAPAPLPEALEPVPTAPAWSPAQRFGFRFAFAFVLLNFLPLPLGFIPGLKPILAPYDQAWIAIGSWVGHHLLRIPANVALDVPGGDRRVDFIVIGVCLFAALCVAAVWTPLDRHRTEYRVLARWLRTYVRVLLAAVMLSYGFSKVFKTQFLLPQQDFLFTNIGAVTPQRLMWLFIGYSTPYTVFGGLGEVTGAVLLLFRRTVTLGALIITAVFTNVVMLDLSYGVDAKIAAISWLVLALGLAAPDARRLANVLVFNRLAPPRSIEPGIWQPKHRWVRTSVKAIAVALIVGFFTWTQWTRFNQWGDAAPKPALFGTYEVESFQANGEELPPLLTEPLRWRRFAVLQRRWGSVQAMDDRWTRMRIEDDPSTSTWILTPFEGVKTTETLRYIRPDPQHLVLDGTWHGQPVSIRLRIIDRKSIELLNHPFRWTQDD